MTFPHTYENGITILRKTSNGAYIITDGLMCAFVIENYIRPDGTLTTCGQKALLKSEWTLEQFEKQNRDWQEKVEREKRDWQRQKEEGSKLVTYVLEQGVLMSASTGAYKYAYGRGYDIYHRPCTHYNYIPKSQVKVERRNCKVYVTLPKWLAEKNSLIFNVIA